MLHWLNFHTFVFGTVYEFLQQQYYIPIQIGKQIALTQTKHNDTNEYDAHDQTHCYGVNQVTSEASPEFED